MANEGDFIPLNALHTGEKGRIAKLTGGHSLRNRMLALGLTPGAEVTVLQNYGRGPMLVRVRDVRVALGRGEAAKVLVQRGEE
ncbi:MAG: ferrous iron transport protein A [Thermoflexia bacterium]|nr:MAG: ferrous iron transport protein A [Thermoflexia bacterium]